MRTPQNTNLRQILSAVMFTLPLAFSAVAYAEGPDAAVVNGIPISKARVDLLVNQRMSTGQSDTPELRKAIIDQLAMQLLVSQAAVKEGLDKRPEVADQIELTRQSILANAFVQDYMKSHLAGDDKQVQQQLKKLIDEMKAKAKINILD